MSTDLTIEVTNGAAWAVPYRVRLVAALLAAKQTGAVAFSICRSSHGHFSAWAMWPDSVAFAQLIPVHLKGFVWPSDAELSPILTSIGCTSADLYAWAREQENT
jgi:hypothetical protein